MKEEIQVKKNILFTLAFILIHLLEVFYFTILYRHIRMTIYVGITGLIYLRYFLLAKKQRDAFDDFVYLIFMCIEVALHAVFATLILSKYSGAEFYLLSSLAAVFLFGANYKRPVKQYILLGLIPICTILITNILPSDFKLTDNNYIPVTIIRFTSIILSIASILILCLTNRAAILRTQNENNNHIEELKFFSNYDPLTKILNRRSMQKLLKEMPLYTLVMFDIDDFKKLNDTYGHECGDIVLTELTKRISTYLTDDVAFSRWGGEEFLIVYPYHSESTILSITGLNNIVSKDIYNLNGTEVKVTITGGVGFSKPGVEFDKILSQADELLYNGKKNGKNQIVFPESY